MPARANGPPAFHCLLPDAAGAAHPAGLLVVTLRGDRVGALTRFLDGARA